MRREPRPAHGDLDLKFATLPGGKRLRDEEMHLWNVNAAGKVTRFRHYADTAKHIAVAR